MNMKNAVTEFETQLDKIFTFWTTQAIDPVSGQFYGSMKISGEKNAEANKGIIMYTRLLWSFSAASIQYKSQVYANLADKCFNFLQNHFFDSEYGGYIWETNHKGEVIDDKKQTYAQAFALYAITEYYKLTNKEEVAQLVHKQFNVIIQNCFDSVEGGYFEGYTRDWKFDKLNRLSEKDDFAEKSMNTNLHILEAFTSYYEVFKTQAAYVALKRIVLDFSKYIIGPDNHLILFMDADWTQQSWVHSYGHDIETSWLLWEAAEVLHDEVILEYVKPIVLHMVDTFVKEGIDEEYAVLNERNVKMNHIDTDRHWWPQCEALEGLANAYAITQNNEYLSVLLKVWEYIKSNVIDEKSGEWFAVVHENGTPDPQEEIGGRWKTPYHNGRALMKLVQRFS